MTKQQIIINKKQGEFLASNHKYKLYVGGFRSGKTFIGAVEQNIEFRKKKQLLGYFAPTYPMIRDIYYPTAKKVAELLGHNIKINLGNKEAHYYSGNRYIGTTMCRSMDNPDNIAGFEIGGALVDEIDRMKTEKANDAWINIIARLSLSGCKNNVSVTTTPEGFKFAYNKFVKDLINNESSDKKLLYGMVRASTHENKHNLPDGYVESLRASYPAHLIEPYLNGEFRNLASGQVYRSFNRDVNATNETIKSGEELHVGMDFNVNNMAAVICVIRNGSPMALDEITGCFDTPDVIDTIKSKYSNHSIAVYPDASGKNRKSVGATETDISLLRSANFRVKANEANPLIRDRVNSVNGAFDNQGLLINVDKCKSLTETLERQAYDKNNKPEKDSGLDHCGDAFGYFIHYKYKINKSNSGTISIGIH